MRRRFGQSRPTLSQVCGWCDADLTQPRSVIEHGTMICNYQGQGSMTPDGRVKVEVPTLDVTDPVDPEVDGVLCARCKRDPHDADGAAAS